MAPHASVTESLEQLTHCMSRGRDGD